MKFKVICDLHEYNEESNYDLDRGTTFFSYNTKGIYLLDEDDPAPDVFTDDPVLYSSYYLLVVTYDTGDSFGHENGVKEYVSVHSDYNVALENHDRIRDHFKICKKDNLENFDNLYLELKTDQGREFTITCPWTDYFTNDADPELFEVPVIRNTTEE